MSATSEQHWKEKYHRLLDKLDAVEREFQTNEALLCKTIVRLATASKGFNPNLDPHLTRIAKVLRDSLDSQRLQSELDRFTDALVNLEDAPEQKDADSGLLFDFLRHLSTTPEEKTRWDILEADYLNGRFKMPRDLFSAIAQAMPVALRRGAIASSPTLNLDTPLLRRHLLELLQAAEIPPERATQANALICELQNDSDPEAFLLLLNSAIDLLLALKQHSRSQQQELVDFLATLTERLNELGQKALGVSAVTQESSLSFEQFGRSMTVQMQELQSDSANATTLEPLKKLINARLTTIGQLLLEHKQQEERWRAENQAKLDELNATITHMESETKELNHKLQLAQQRALRDPLTELPNRLAYWERCQIELARQQRYQTPLSWVIWDIDHFKQINDQYGHKAGDKALKIIASLLQKHCRQVDFVCRFGGEEFVMMLPETARDDALKLANALRHLIEKTKFNANGQLIPVTVSCGIAELAPGEDAEAVFERADQALYQAKNSGRNRCIAA